VSPSVTETKSTSTAPGRRPGLVEVVAVVVEVLEVVVASVADGLSVDVVTASCRVVDVVSAELPSSEVEVAASPASEVGTDPHADRTTDNARTGQRARIGE